MEMHESLRMDRTNQFVEKMCIVPIISWNNRLNMNSLVQPLSCVLMLTFNANILNKKCTLINSNATNILAIRVNFNIFTIRSNQKIPNKQIMVKHHVCFILWFLCIFMYFFYVFNAVYVRSIICVYVAGASLYSLCSSMIVLCYSMLCLRPCTLGSLPFGFFGAL